MRKYHQDIVLIHGLWMTPLSWENWVNRFQERGYSVLTPTWPQLEGKSVEEIRRNPDALRGVGLGELISHFEEVLESFEIQPMIIGHSFGGIFTQLLLDRGYGATGVAINSAPVQGVWRLPVTTLKAAWPGIKKPWKKNELVAFTFEEFNYAFTNGMPLDEAIRAYEKYCIPAPVRPLLQVAFANLTPNAVTHINFRNDQRAPLLLTAGTNDNITPVSLNKENFSRYHSQATTEYKEFQGRNHYTIGQNNWEDLADYCLDWSLEHRKTSFYSLGRMNY